jgi:hypothetical protein
VSLTRSLLRLNFALFVGVIFLLCVFDGHHTNDTSSVVDGARHLAACFSGGSLQLPCPGVSHFPTLQYIPSIFGIWAGLSDFEILRLLTVLSFVSIVGVFFLVESVGRVAPLVLMTGPLLYYARCSYGEALGAFMITWYIAELVRFRSVGWVILAGTLAGLTKETSPPFLALLGAGVVFERSFPRDKKQAALLGCGISVLFAVGLNCLFNFVRFDSVFNFVYLMPRYQVHELRYFVSNISAIWFSPNGGLLIFWPLWGALFFFVLKKFPKHPAMLASAIALVGLSLGFAKWHTPLGWRGWGPRFLLPWLPAILLIALWVGGESVQTALRDWRSRPKRFAISVILLVLVALPQGLILIDPRPFGHLFEASETCPKTPDIELDPAYFDRCIQESHWPKRPIWVDQFVDSSEPLQLVFAMNYLLVLVGLFKVLPE